VATIAAVCAAVPLAAAAHAGPGRNEAPAADAKPLAGLRVLITNDDSAQGRDTRFGTDGRGLYELRRSMCEAGADVVVVAPWTQQSGASARAVAPGLQPVPLSVQPVTVPAAYAGDCADSDVARDGTGVFGVCVADGGCTSTSTSGSPADAVNVAMTRFLSDNYWPEGPDLVLSGANFGHNVAGSANHSGTIGAAVTAMEYDTATIAVSAEAPKELAKLSLVPFAAAGDFTAELVARLRTQGLLTPDLALNVNQPFLDAGETAGPPAMTVIGESNDIPMLLDGSVGVTGGTYYMGVGEPSAEPLPNADITALRANRVSITVLDGNWGASRANPKLEKLVRNWDKN